MTRRANSKMAGKKGYSKHGRKLGRPKGKGRKSKAATMGASESIARGRAQQMAKRKDPRASAGGFAGRRTASAKADPRASAGGFAGRTTRKAKKAKKGEGKQAGQIWSKKHKKWVDPLPLNIMEKRLKSLNNLVKKRGGEGLC